MIGEDWAYNALTADNGITSIVDDQIFILFDDAPIPPFIFVRQEAVEGIRLLDHSRIEWIKVRIDYYTETIEDYRALGQAIRDCLDVHPGYYMTELSAAPPKAGSLELPTLPEGSLFPLQHGWQIYSVFAPDL